MDPAELVESARLAREHAYAPYSRYRVGAAVLTGSGRVFTGVNVENASYGLTVCAERAAVFAATAAGALAGGNGIVGHGIGGNGITALAVVTEDGATPCGACRQVLWELGRDAQVYMARPDGSYREMSVAALLPEAFRVPPLPRRST